MDVKKAQFIEFVPLVKHLESMNRYFYSIYDIVTQVATH